MNHEGVGHISEDNMSQNSLGDGLAQLSSENVEERATFQRQLDNPLFCKQIVSELKNSGGKEQLEYISLLYQAAQDSTMKRLEEYYWVYGEGTYPLDIGKGFNNAIEILTDIEKDSHISPLSRIVSKHLSNKLKQTIDDPYMNAVTDRESSKKQAKLHRNYPFFSPEERLIQIAPDAVASTTLKYSYEHLNELANTNGDKINLPKIIDDGSLGSSEDGDFLLGIIHTTGIKESIDDFLGIKLEDIHLGAQIELLKYMTAANNDRLDKLCATMHKIDKKMRLGLAENFLAAGFGEDFGDSLLEIASSERLTNKEKAQILDNMSSCRESIGVIAGWYGSLDEGNFAKQYARAANERLTDIITVFREIAKKGTATADSGRGEPITFDYKSAIEALKYETKSLEMISGTVQDVADGQNGAFAEVVVSPDKSHSSKNRTVYNLYSPRHGYVLLHTRSEGTHSFDPQLEYGKVGSRYNPNSVNTGTEASISFMANPVEPFSLPTPFKDLPWYKQNNLRPRGKKSDIEKAAENYKRNRVSANRLDREGIPLGAPANDPNRDPVAPQGRVSVDLSAIGDKPNTPSGKIARLITLGNMIRAKEQGSNEIYLNHNTKWFDEKYGTTDGFKRLVKHIDTLMCGDGRTYPGLVGLRPPAEGEGLIEKWRELGKQLEKRRKNQRRGKKAMKTTDLLKKMSKPVPSLDTPNPSNAPDTSGPDVA